MDVLHSVVVPVNNEEQGIALFHARCAAAMEGIGESFEIIYVEDGSKDGTWNLLVDIAERDPRVRIVRFSRNFGHQVAISAGVQHASGETITTIDSDLQDPPEVIERMVQAWRGGADIVYAVRTKRQGETWFKRASAALFYRLINSLSDVELPVDAGDFRLLSRRANAALNELPEHHRYVRGMVAWLGFETARIEYSREARAAGETKYPLAKMVRLALDGIMAFSIRPLRIATWTGIAASAAAFLMAVVLVVRRLAGGYAVQGWTSLMVLVLMLAGVQLLTVGVLGEYVGRIYTEVRRRPLYIVGETRGFSASLGDKALDAPEK